MRGRALALGAALVLMSALGAHAQDDDEDESEYYFAKEDAGYMEVYAGAAYFKINGSDGGDDGSGGAGVTVGKHITPNLAMDVTYEFQSYSKTSLAHYALKWVFRPESRIQPYLKAGAGLMGGRPNHPFLFMGRFDAGLGIFLTEQVALRTGVGYAVAKHSNHVLLGNVGIVYYMY